MTLAALKIKIFADGADLASIRKLAGDPLVKGFTTNPSLMRKAGVTDYVTFARKAIAVAGARPISFEVFADDMPTMAAQAREIASWGDNVYVKIPVMNSEGQSCCRIIGALSRDGIKLNVTAMMTLEQVCDVARALDDKTPAILSIFAGRIADTGRDPAVTILDARTVLHNMQRPRVELLWASVREPLNLMHAERCGCDIITLPPDVLAKTTKFYQRNLDGYSRETVGDFRRDAVAAGYDIPLKQKVAA